MGSKHFVEGIKRGMSRAEISDRIKRLDEWKSRFMDIGYRSNLMAACAIIVDESVSKVLLVKRSVFVYPWPETYMLGAGGKIEANESPKDGLIREVWEEIYKNTFPLDRMTSAISDLIPLDKFKHSFYSEYMEVYPYIMYLKPYAMLLASKGYDNVEIAEVNLLSYSSLLNSMDDIFESITPPFQYMIKYLKAFSIIEHNRLEAVSG